MLNALYVLSHLILTGEQVFFPTLQVRKGKLREGEQLEKNHSIWASQKLEIRLSGPASILCLYYTPDRVRFPDVGFVTLVRE